MSEKLTAAELDRVKGILAAIDASYSAKVVGQASLRRSLLIGLITGGHILLESVPGLAKTTAAQAIERPSKVAVPRPSSSRMTSDRSVA